MKIFYTSSITGMKKFKKNCESVYKILKDHGYRVHAGFLNTSKKEDRKKTQNESKKVYDYIVEKIKTHDVFIGEMSFRSAPVSYQLTYALEHKKPSLYLYEKGRGNSPHAVFTGNSSRYLVIKEYTFDTLEDIVLEFLKDAKKLLMKRFNFVIPAELDEYLSVTSAFEGISKGEMVRKMIEEYKEKDRRFKEVMRARSSKLGEYDCE